MRIGLFIPCYIDAFFPEVGIATLELLERFGHEIVYPRDQTCCGQPMANSGFNAEAAGTEALFVRNFSGFDYVVAPSGSCVPFPGPDSRIGSACIKALVVVDERRLCLVQVADIVFGWILRAAHSAMSRFGARVRACCGPLLNLDETRDRKSARNRACG
jgi:hypothetical protein